MTSMLFFALTDMPGGAIKYDYDDGNASDPYERLSLRKQQT